MTDTESKTTPPEESAAEIQKDQLRKLLTTSGELNHPGAFGSVRAFSWRSMLKIKHVPEQLFDVTVFPVMMLLMFTYLFGGAIAGGTGDYLQFLLPGIIVMSVVMTSMYTGTQINVDINKGVFDRFRTLPIWRPAPMVGYLAADLFRYAGAGLIMFVTGLLMGYRPDGGLVGVALGLGLLLVFSFSFSWIWTWFGIILRSEKSVMGVSMGVMFPMTFLSNIMVDPATMPGWLGPVVSNTPVSQLVTGVRGFFNGEFEAAAIATTLLWCAGFIIIFGALTLRAYNRK
ncbi:ABC transporter permease [Natronoglycomyces albus]